MRLIHSDLRSLALAATGGDFVQGNGEFSELADPCLCGALALGDLPAMVNSPAAVTPWLVLAQADFTIGGAGAVSATDGDMGVTLANSGTGTFNLVYPACLKVRFVFTLQSAAATVTECVATAKSATAGTAAIRTSKAGTATNPANGDIITVLILGQTR